MKQPTDKRSKKPTRKQQEQIFKERVAVEMQKWYLKGIAHGSDMQCSSILTEYKQKYDETPKSKRTKAFLEEMIDNIFKFCEKGVASDLEATLGVDKDVNTETALNNANAKDE